ncbi:MAG: hypothetical protein AB7O80_18550 [Acetobacteraceae bacterium]
MRLKGAAVLAAAIALSGCAQQVANREDMMIQAGFTKLPANTPQRKQALKALPAHKFSMQVRNNQAVWVYPDPTICGCLYVGGQIAYDQYRRIQSEQRMENEAQTAQWLNQNNAIPYPMSFEPWNQGGQSTAPY